MNRLAESDREGDRPYLVHFEFLEPPFPNAPGPRFECGTRSRARILEAITDGINRREGLILVIGDEGTGKTTLSLALPQHFGPRTFASVIVTAPATADDLLGQLLIAFGLTDSRRAIGPSNREAQYSALQGFFLSLAPLQGQAVIVIDDAHTLPLSVLEEILRLTNFDENHPGLLQVVLMGHPTLLEVLQESSARPLFERVVGRHPLPPFTDFEVGQYIERQIWIARGGIAALPAVANVEGPVPGARGGSCPHFTPSAIDVIAGSSSGNPRAINAICDRALAMAHDLATNRITGRVAKRAAADLGLRPVRRRLWLSTPKAASVMVATLAAGGLVSASWQERWPSPAPPAIEAPSVTPDHSFDAFRSESLRLGTSLAAEPDVKGLLKLRNDVHRWDIDTKYASHAAVEGLLVEIERLTNAARQRQLDVDRTLILDASKKHAP